MTDFIKKHIDRVDRTVRYTIIATTSITANAGDTIVLDRAGRYVETIEPQHVSARLREVSASARKCK